MSDYLKRLDSSFLSLGFQMSNLKWWLRYFLLLLQSILFIFLLSENKKDNEEKLTRVHTCRKVGDRFDIVFIL